MPQDQRQKRKQEEEETPSPPLDQPSGDVPEGKTEEDPIDDIVEKAMSKDFRKDAEELIGKRKRGEQSGQ